MNDKQSIQTERVRDHEFDGIQEYDNRLPNWWLYTLYITIVFSIMYWFVAIILKDVESDGNKINHALAEIDAKRLTSAGNLSDDSLWKMSKNSEIISSGKEIYTSTCLACHGDKLQGGVGLNLADQEWRHCNTPMDVYAVIDKGIPATGMAAWGNILGPKKTSKVTAYILSYHKEEEGFSEQ